MSQDLRLAIHISADGKSAKAELTTLNGELVKVGRTADSSTEQMNRGFSSVRREANLLAITAGRLAGVLSVASAVAYSKTLIEAADRAAILDSRLKLVTNSAAQFAAVQSSIYRQAQAIGGSIEAQADLYGKLARATEGSGRSAHDLLAITDIIAKNLRISGTSAEAAAGAMLQFGQAAGSGVVRAEEFNSMLEGMPTLVQGVAKALGMTSAELRGFVNQGKISSDQWLDAMLKMRTETDRQVSAMAETFSQATARASNAFLRFNAEVAKQSGLSKFFTDLANSVANYLDRWTNNVDPVKNAIQEIQNAALKLFELQAKFDRNPAGSNLIERHFQTGEIAKAEAALAEAESRFRRIQPIVQQAADSLEQGFGKAAYAVEDVGKKADATAQAVAQAAKKYGIPESILVTVAKLESNFDQLAVSAKGAVGVMQLMPGTAKDLGVNAKDAMQNIEGGARYLKQMFDEFGDWSKALAAYNMGPGNLQRFGTGSKAAQDYFAAFDRAAQELKAKYPNGMLADVLSPKEQNEIQDASYQAFVAHLQAVEDAANAAAERQKGALDTEIAALEARANALKEPRSRDEGVEGARRIADSQEAILRQIAELKGRQIALDIQAAKVALDGINQQIAAADRLGLTEIKRQELQSRRIKTETDLAGLAQLRAQAEIAAGQRIADAELQVTAAQRQQAAERQKSIDALNDYITGLQAKTDALQTGNELLSEEAELTRLIAEIPKGADAGRQIGQAQQMLQQYKALKKAVDEQRKAEQAVSDERLRQGQYFQVMVQQAQSAAKSLKEAFGGVGEALGGIWVAFAENAQYAYQIQSQLEDQLKRLGDSEEDKAKRIELQGRAANEQLAAQFGMWGDIAGAATQFFDKGSSGYETLRGASQAFHVAQMAIYVAEQIQAAILGIANQAQGDPYSAWARMAAMAATMGALGIAVSSGGGGKGAVAKTQAAQQNKGTVLGDSDAVSKSIANSLEILKQNSQVDLDYSARMTRSLQNIEYAMAGVARSVLVNVNALSGLAGQSAKMKGMAVTPGMVPPAMFGDIGGVFLAKFLDKFLFKTTAKIKDWGIGAWPQQLSEILKSGSMQLKTWTDVEFKTKFLGFLTVSKKTKTYLSDASSEMEREFGRVIISLADGLREGAKAFGMGADEFMRQLQDFQVSWDAQSLKGLKGDELADAISAQFSAIADKMAAALDIHSLDEFQQIGEGLFETLIRVAGGINQAKGELEALNIKMVDYRDIVYKQGDVAGELARQSIIAFEGAGSAIGQFMQDAVGSIEDIIATYRDLVAIRDAMNALGLESKNLTRAMTEAVGGVSKLRDAFESFQSNYLNQGEQLGVQLESLAREFANLGYAIPDSKDAFRALVESIDTSTEAGQKLFARLLSLSDAFAQAADSAKALDDLLKSYTDPLAKFKEPLQKIIDDFDAILSGTLGGIEAKYANMAQQQKNEFNAPYLSQIDQKKAYIGVRQSEIDQNLQYLQMTNDRIAELQGLIARFSGVKGAAGYVAAWQRQLAAMQRQAEMLKGDIAAKTSEVDRINKEIQALFDEMAKGDAAIDAAAAKAKLEALRREKREILKAEGDALLQTLRDTWDNMISGIRDLRQSLDRQIAELKGPRALLRYSQNQADRSFNRAMNYKGKDPEEAVRRIKDAMSAVMDAYAQQMERINRQIQRQAQKIEHHYAKLIRHEERLLQKRIDAINKETDAKLKALQKQTDADVEAVNQQMDAELKALDKRYEAEQKALQGQLDAAKQMQDAVKGIADYLKNLRLGQYSPLSPEDKLAEAKAQFEDLLAKARAGDAAAAAKLSSGSDAYLQAAQSYYGSGPQYAQIFQQVQQALSGVAGMPSTDPESIQAKIDLLREQQQADAQAIRDKFQSQIDEIRASADKTAEAIREAADRQILRAERRADRHIKELEKARDKLIKDLSDPNKNEALKELREKTVDQLKKLRERLREEEEKAREKMRELIQTVRDLGILNAAQLRQLNKIATKMGAELEPVPPYASGGMASPGLALVGEQGPELVRFTAPARVYPAGETAALLGGGTQGEIKLMREELRREVRALVVTQTEANPRIVEELESINDRLASVERRQRLAA